jgi:hypothetical protein
MLLTSNAPSVSCESQSCVSYVCLAAVFRDAQIVSGRILIEANIHVQGSVTAIQDRIHRHVTVVRQRGMGIETYHNSLSHVARF